MKLLNYLKVALLTITLVSAVGRADDQIYVIGDFNEWNIPDADNMNGALPLGYDPEENIHSGTFNFSAGDTNFAFYCHSEKDVFIGRDKQFTPATVRLVKVLADDGLGNTYENKGLAIHLTEAKNLERIDALTLRDWQGGDIYFEIYGRGLLNLDADDMPYFTPDTNDMNIVYRINGGDWRIQESPIKPSGAYMAGKILYGKEIEFFYTTEFSTDPAPENIWGIEEEDAIIPMDPDGLHYNNSLVTDMVKGGHPVKVIFDEWGGAHGTFFVPWSRFSLSFSHYTQPSEVYATIEEDGVERTAEMELSADFTSELTAHGKNIKVLLYQKTDSATDEEIKEIGKSLMYDYHDFQSHFTTPEYQFNRIELSKYGHPIELEYDTPTDIRIHIMWSSESADIYELPTDGIIRIDEPDIPDDTLLEYYDLTGKRVSNPGKGIYIVKNSNGYRKVML